jgi:hypothetical protein
MLRTALSSLHRATAATASRAASSFASARARVGSAASQQRSRAHTFPGVVARAGAAATAHPHGGIASAGLLRLYSTLLDVQAAACEKFPDRPFIGDRKSKGFQWKTCVCLVRVPRFLLLRVRSRFGAAGRGVVVFALRRTR